MITCSDKNAVSSFLSHRLCIVNFMVIFEGGTSGSPSIRYMYDCDQQSDFKLEIPQGLHNFFSFNTATV